MIHPQQGYSILIADDSKAIIEGLTAIMQGAKLIGSVQSVMNGKEAVKKVLEGGIDCVLMDIQMPVMDGYEATTIIKLQKPAVKLVMVSMWLDEQIITRLLAAGADAFVLKDVNASELLAAIEKVMRNEKYISPKLNVFPIAYPGLKNDLPLATNLTTREKEIIHFIAGGMDIQMIAEKLFLQVHTVEAHRKNILAKLGLKNTAALAKYALVNKLA